MANDEIAALKGQLADLIVARLDGWSQINAAAFLGTDQPRISDLRRGQLERFSLEQLVRFVERVVLKVEWRQSASRLFADV